MKTYFLFKSNNILLEDRIFEFLKSRWVLVLVLVIFTILKIPHLLYPFYWDESWPYVPAIKAMYHHGISLLPNSIDPIISRGHPLFFHAIGALWMNIFGTSNLSLHCFALFISVSFLITIFEAGYRFFNKRVAVLGLLLVAGHVSFFVQSSFVLFEILVAFLCFLSICLYVSKKYYLAALSLTALFLTKESGTIAGFVIGIDALIHLFNKNYSIKERLLRLIPVTTATIALGLFFVIQKKIKGWYVLPLYTESLQTKWNDIWYRFRASALETTFCQDLEYVIFIAIIILVLVKIFREHKWNNIYLLSISVPIFISYYIIEDKRCYHFIEKTHINPIFITIIFLISYIITFYTYSRLLFNKNGVQKRLILLIASFILCYIIFSSFAYFLPRYMLTSIVPALFLLAVFCEMLTRNSLNIMYYFLVTIILIITIKSFRKSTGWSDNDIGFFNALKVQTGVVEYMERSSLYNKYISSGSYLTREHLIDPYTGFLSSEKSFNKIDFDIKPNTEYVIFDNIETDARYDAVKRDSAYILVYRITNGPVWAEIYKTNIR